MAVYDIFGYAGCIAIVLAAPTAVLDRRSPCFALALALLLGGYAAICVAATLQRAS